MRKIDFLQQLQRDLPSPVSARKNILLRARPKSPLQLRPSRPGRGALAIVTNVGAGCGGRGSVGRVSCSQGGLRFVSGHNAQTTGEAAYGKAVWSWHPLLVSSWRRKRRPNRVSTILQSAGDGGKRNSSPGRARYKPSNHCAGNAGVLQLYLYARVRFFCALLHTRPRVQQAPGIPCALFFDGRMICKPRVHRAARLRRRVLRRPWHCERSDTNQLPTRIGDGYRCARPHRYGLLSQ